ncbi:MAG: hypothetical protein ACE5JU_19030 [Candidatus Binatia bacterium]
MKQKMAIWTALLLLGGVAYLSSRGAIYFAGKAKTTLSSWSPVHRLLDCLFVGQTFESLQSSNLPDLDATAGVARHLPSYSNSEVELTQITVQAPPFLQCQVEKVDVGSFSGLAPPRLSVSLIFKLNAQGSVQTGTWPVRLVAYARLKPGYWAKHLQTAVNEVSQLEKTGTPEQIERARRRLKDLQNKASLMARALPIEGQGTITVESTSRVTGVGARLISGLLGLLALVSGGGALLIGAIYLLKLKAGDIEP